MTPSKSCATRNTTLPTHFEHTVCLAYLNTFNLPFLTRTNILLLSTPSWLSSLNNATASLLVAVGHSIPPTALQRYCNPEYLYHYGTPPLLAGGDGTRLGWLSRRGYTTAHEHVEMANFYLIHLLATRKNVTKAFLMGEQSLMPLEN